MVTKFSEKPPEPDSTLVSTGCYIFPSKNLVDIVNFAKKSADHLGAIFEYLLGKTPINIFRFEEPWIDIGSFQAYLEAHKKLQKENLVSPDAKLENTTLGNSIYVAENCQIRDSFLENVIIMKNCQVQDCQIKNSIIDENCTLTGIDLDHKMIRQGTRIGE